MYNKYGFSGVLREFNVVGGRVSVVKPGICRVKRFCFIVERHFSTFTGTILE